MKKLKRKARISLNSIKLNKVHFRTYGLLIVLFIVQSAYYACQNVSFQLDPGKILEDQVKASVQMGTVLIENGAEFINKKDVIVNVSFDYASEMYITSDPTCESGGEWEPFNSVKQWTLKDSNTKVSVYAKFKTGEGYPSGCAEDSIVEDEIPPEISVEKIPKYSNSKQFHLNFQSSDRLSGVSKNICRLFPKGSAKSSEVDPCAQGQIYQIDQEGPYESQIVSIDKAGNISNASATWISDFTPPKVSWVSVPSSPSGNQPEANEHRFSATDENGISKVECSFGKSSDPISFSECNSPNLYKPSSIIEGGEYSLSVRAIDLAGNVSDPIKNTWLVKDTYPSLWFTNTDLPKAWSHSKVAHFAYEAKFSGNMIDASKFQCSHDGGSFVTCPNGKDDTMKDLTNGSHTFKVRVLYDTDDKISSPLSYDWGVDLDKPEVSSISGPPQYTKDNESGNFTWKNTDRPDSNNSGIDKAYCSVDGGAFIECTTLQTHTYSGPKLSDGEHQFTVYIVDRAGNSSDPANYKWNVDTQPPTVSITSHPDALTSKTNASFGFKGTDSLSGVDFFTWKIDSGSATVCKPDVQTPSDCTLSVLGPLTEGGHIIKVFSTDKAGNSSTEISFEWKIDITSPVIKIIKQPFNQEYISKGENIVHFSVTDLSPLSSVECGLVGKTASCPLVGSEYKVDLGQLQPGDYKFLIQAKDVLGNTSNVEILWSVTHAYGFVESDLQIFDSNVDILFVVDQSGSMEEEQANLGSRIIKFIDKLNAFSELDWRIGLTSVDVENTDYVYAPYYNNLSSYYYENGVYKNSGTQGQLFLPRLTSPSLSFKSDNFITKSLANAQDYLSQSIQMGKTGSGIEQGIKATNLSLQKALDYKTSQCTDSDTRGICIQTRPNSKFFRDNSHLAVVVISDENESGTGTLNSGDQLLNLVKSQFNNRPFIFNSIVWITNPASYGLDSSMQSTCAAKATETEGGAYLNLSKTTGGVIGNICESDYSNTLVNMGQKVIDLVYSMTLPCSKGTFVLDYNKDGVDDVYINGHAPSDYGNYKKDGNRLVFDKKLATGTYHVKYVCPQ